MSEEIGTEGASAPENVLDIKGRLKWHGHELQLKLFDLEIDPRIRPMITHPDRTKVGTAQARVIVFNLTGRFYSARQMERYHDDFKLGYRVEHSNELVYETGKIVHKFLPKGCRYNEKDVAVDEHSARRIVGELDARNKNQRRLDFRRKVKKAAS